MAGLRVLGALIVAVAGCASAVPPAGTAPATPRARLIADLTEALRRGAPDEAAAILDRARQLPQAARPSESLVAYFDATVHAYAGDYRGAAQVLYDHTAKLGPAVKASFAFHDAMIALRTADGDLLGALVECEEMVVAGTRGTWKPPGDDRMTWVRLKEHWHRAYLLRMIAQTRAGAERQALIGYAERARRDYIAVAAPLHTLGDSIAVLDAYFAFCDGARDAMRAAAQRVHADDDDIEDLYLVQLALDAGGAHDAAAAVRQRMAALDEATALTPVFLAWLQADAATAPPFRFSPRHPTADR